MIRRCFLAWWIFTFSTVSLQSKQYALPGDMVTFEPVIKTPPDEILWKHNGNKVVEFNGNEETVYNPFEKRITLDWHAAVLEIKQLRHDDSGEYELDVLTNKGLNRFSFELEVIDRVAKPSIFCKMNNGSSGSDKSGNEATLMCSADSSKPQSLKYEWSQHGKTHPGPIFEIFLGKEYDDEVYSCTVSNRLSNEMATFTAKDCYLVNRSAGLNDGLSATIGVIVALCVLGALCILFLKLKHKACFAKEKTKDVEQQPSLNEANDHATEPLLERLPTIPSTQRLRPLPGMMGIKNFNQNDEDTELDENAEEGIVRRRTRKFEQNQVPTGLETSEDKLTKTQLPVVEKPGFNGNLARNVKGETDADPHGEEPEKTVLAIDRLEDRSGATQHDLQAFTTSELPESEKEEDEDEKAPNIAPSDEPKEEKQDAIADQVARETEEENAKEKENDSDDLREKKKSPTTDEQTGLENNKDKSKKPPPIVPKKYFKKDKAYVNALRGNKVSEGDGLKEHSGATESDLQSSTASETPESGKQENEEAPNMAPADKHKEEKQDAIADQVAGETEEGKENEKEENDSDDLREKKKSPTSDEQTGLENNKDKSKKPPPIVPKKYFKKDKAYVNALRGNKVSERDGLKEHSGATESDLQSSTASETPGLESNKDKSKNTKPPVPKKFFKKNKEQAAVNAPRGNKVSERDGLKEHSGATESDLQSTTASEKPELEKEADDKAKSAPKNDPGEHVDNSNSKQVTGETNEENVGK